MRALSADHHRSHAALWVTANTGMRRGEIVGLRWSDVDLKDACLSVTRSLVSVGYELHVDSWARAQLLQQTR